MRQQTNKHPPRQAHPPTCSCVTPSMGAMGCKSTATMQGRAGPAAPRRHCRQIQPPAQHLAPAARRGAQVHHMSHAWQGQRLAEWLVAVKLQKGGCTAALNCEQVTHMPRHPPSCASYPQHTTAQRTRKDVKRVVELQQLERGAGAPPLLLGLTVVDVALVLARPPHGRGLPAAGQLADGSMREKLGREACVGGGGGRERAWAAGGSGGLAQAWGGCMV